MIEHLFLIIKYLIITLFGLYKSLTRLELWKNGQGFISMIMINHHKITHHYYTLMATK